ncbi:EmrB/QacA family drug resistance transporter [Actinomadura craniellae]|uniref:EmrB/QacA family drug resistance transporter n=1 Tax=Actinomadura craniellae TaxID=2231787 RepID=A0A365H911_9ACTN|nr:MDR family MFS transporter [Actinomadura craniellae]RAY15620.1 EmrB/QacA family drug resistance transporter [Actinomadura craniellae]
MTHRQTLEALSGLLLVLFAAMLSATVVSTALPQIIGALHGGQSQFTWVVTATLLSSTATTPIWSKLADLYSKKTLLQASIVIFMIGSLVSGFAQDAGQLIAARAFQGLGLGGVQSLVQVVIAAMISPRERGRYFGYLGGVMALATVGGPLLGGLIVDVSWLGWRWCFFIGVPVAAVAFLLLQKTLKLPVLRRDNVKIDYLGATLIAAGVCVLLIWVTFVGESFAWASWQTAAMAGSGVLVLALAVWVESRAAEPVVPLDIVRRRNTALSIVASLAVGMAMFGGAVFLGQYFQIGRGYSPTEAGLLTIPMMVGVLVSSTISGRLTTKTGQVKPYILTGTIVLAVGFAVLGTVDHQTSLYLIGAAMLLVGAGVGMSMQNLVLVVQNSVPLSELGAASGAVTFFRSLGGTIGVSVLGAVLAARVSDLITRQLAAAGVQGGGDAAGSLDLAALPEPVREIVRAAYGDATGHIFMIAAGIAVVGIVAALFLKPVSLRDSLDLPAQETPVEVPAAAGKS